MRVNIPKRLIVRHRETDNATILRGLAAVAVVLIHYDGFGLRNVFKNESNLDNLANTFVSLGIYGPAVFFLASGFALSASLENRDIKLIKFLNQRFFRLWPLYAIVLLSDLLYRYVSSKDLDHFAIKNTLLHLTFLDVFNADYFYSDPIGVLSSVPIEFWWSFLIPIALLLRRRSRYLELPLLGIVIFLSFFLEHLNPENTYFAEYGQNKWWVFGTCFYLGNIAFEIRKRMKTSNNLVFLLSASCVSIFLELFRMNLLYTILMISFMYLVFGDKINSSSGIAQALNDVLLCVGTICYSIYLLHLPVRKLFFTVTDVGLTLNVLSITCVILLSCLSYLYIEVPIIKFGKRFR